MNEEDTSYALQPGKVFSSDGKAMFKIMDVLGTGGFGITYRVKHHNGLDYALKEYFHANSRVA